MSQHIFSTAVDGKPVSVMLGWDRPLQQYFMVVEWDVEFPQNDSEDCLSSNLFDKHYLYSNLFDKQAAGQDIEYFKEKLEALGVQVPGTMFTQACMDRRENAGNRICNYQVDGTFTDSASPQAKAVNSIVPNMVGELAKHFCGKELPLQVMSSRSGFYIGTCDDDGPVSRESAEYFRDEAAADAALSSGSWVQKLTP